MAQHDYNIANGSGAAVRSDINSLASAIATKNSGSTEPLVTFAHMSWYDSTLNILKYRNPGNTAWINFASITSTALIILATRSAPVTQNADFTVADTDADLIITKSSSCVVTLPAPASYVGRALVIKTTVAFTTVSASANVVPLIGGAAGTAILAATAGKYARIKSDGTNWVIMEAN